MSNNKLNYIPVLEEDCMSRYLAALKYKLISFGLWQQIKEISIQHEILGHFKFLYITNGSYTLTVNGVEYEIKSVELLSKNIPLQELADSYGFSSANYFSTIFKKYYGCSPSAYKQKHVEKLNSENII